MFIERADNSARLLDVKYFVLLPKPQYVGGNIDNMQWSILLRSLSSFRAFRWAYDGNITATKIADFLVLNNNCPRSLSFCIQNIVKHLTNLTCSPEKVSKIYNTLKDLNTKIQEEKIESIVDLSILSEERITESENLIIKSVKDSKLGSSIMPKSSSIPSK